MGGAREVEELEVGEMELEVCGAGGDGGGARGVEEVVELEGGRR